MFMNRSFCAPVDTARFRVGGAALWIARWMLVLLLAFDQFSGPLHQHEHIDGVSAHALSAVFSSDHSGSLQATGELPPSISHAVMAVKQESFQADWQDLNLSSLTAFIATGAHQAQSENGLRLGRCFDRPDPQPPSCRHLAPPGRAPPLAG